MATQLQVRRGTTAQMTAFTGAEGELAVNTSTDTVHVHDGSTAGGFALAKADGSNIGTYAGSFTTISASGAITGNVTGNLTGSVLTAAQTNITSVGTLTGLTLSGTFSLPNANATNEISFTGTEFTNVLSATTSGFQFGTTGAGYLSFLTSNTERLRIDGATGNVGIGISSMVNPLHVGVTPNTASKTSGSAFDGGALRLDGNLANAGDESAILAGSNDGLSAGIGFMRESGANWGTALKFYTHSPAITTTDELTERMRIDSAGNVGIGASPLSLTGNATPGLTVSSNGPFILLQDANNADKVRYMSNNSGEFQFGIVGDDGATGKTEHMRLTAAGNVGIGCSPTQELEIKAASIPTLKLNQAGTYGAEIALRGNDLDIAGSANAIVFYTGGNNDVSATERMRLTASGSLKVKGPESAYISTAEYHEFTASVSSIAMYVYNPNASAGAAGILINVNNEASDANGYFLRGYSNLTARDNFYVYSNGNVVNRNNSFGPLSDQKLKQDIVDANNQWEDFKAIKFRKFRFKDDVIADPNTPYQLGVVAQELEAAGLNGLVSESPDKEFYQETVTDDDGNDVLDEDGNAVTEQKERLTGETTKSVKMSILYAKGMVALQEAMERIETLEAKVQTLENN